MNLPDTPAPPERHYQRLKATPDFPGIIIIPDPDELDEFKILWEYEQALEESARQSAD